MSEINFKFVCCRTTGLTETTKLNDPDFLSKFDCNKTVAFVIHGWIDDGTSVWLPHMVNRLSSFHNINACAVGWGSLSKNEYLLTSLGGTRIVSDIVTAFINKLIANSCIAISNVQLIGHSLGAHIAGYIGNEFDGAVPVIFGLDPAGPRYSYPVVVDPYWRLDPTDAELVVAIHSCDPILGIKIETGHQDVFINRGEWASQKGCFPFNYIDAYRQETIECAHYRAVQFMDYSIDPANNAACRMIQCNSLDEYNAKACNGSTATFGYNTEG